MFFFYPLPIADQDDRSTGMPGTGVSQKKIYFEEIILFKWTVLDKDLTAPPKCQFAQDESVNGNVPLHHFGSFRTRGKRFFNGDR